MLILQSITGNFNQILYAAVGATEQSLAESCRPRACRILARSGNAWWIGPMINHACAWCQHAFGESSRGGLNFANCHTCGHAYD